MSGVCWHSPALLGPFSMAATAFLHAAMFAFASVDSPSKALAYEELEAWREMAVAHTL